VKVYLDNAATTKVADEVFRAMRPYFLTVFGNASEPHDWGQQARRAINQSRQTLATFLGAKPQEIIFTSCATESINLSHKGLIESTKYQVPSTKRPHIITTQIEHKAVLEACKHLEKLGWATVTYLPVDKTGLVSVKEVAAAIKPETVLVSVMYVNNEVGTIEPIAEIGKLIKRLNVSRLSSHLSRIYFHTDATQGIQYLDCQVERLGVDLLSLTGHKFGAPKGIGALYVRAGTPLVRQLDGGGQEAGRRAGTENVPYIVGLGKAVELVEQNKEQRAKNIEELRDKLIDGVLKTPGIELTGHLKLRAPHIASFTVAGAEGEAILLLLSDKGVAVSSGSACTSGTLEPSHVLTAMGIPPEIAHGSLRFSLGKATTAAEIDYVIKIFPGIISHLRHMAPKL